MKTKLLELTEASTEFVESNNLQYYWEVDGFKFSNIHLMKWYENTYNGWASFVAQPLSLIKQTLEKDKNIDLDYNYNQAYIKKLRQENQSLKLFFSGGYDSALVFHEAIENNIIFDQILSCISGYNDSSIDLPENNEVRHNVLPYLEKYNDHVKSHEYIVASRENLKNLYSDPYGFFKPICSDSAPFYFRQIWSGFKNNSQDCYIRGGDKPTLMYYQKNWYIVLMDTATGSTPYSNVKYFWFEPDNIKSLIKDAILYRNYIVKKHGTPNKKLSFFKPSNTNLEENLIINRRKLLSDNTQYPKRKPGEVKSAKDDLAMIDCINNEEHHLLSDFYQCYRKFHEIFPDCINGYQQYNSGGKFGWMINIDTREAYSQQELIPNGFEL